MARGNCYYASEALFHILGGRAAGWKAMRLRIPDDTHWFLKHDSGMILDPSQQQFTDGAPDYQRAVGAGFLTKAPSKKAQGLIKALTWQA